jgi:apolipoprotein N-acyltransferase
MIRGDGIVPPLETAYGRLATLICYDADHADLVARAAGGADLLLLPSNDWRAIDPLHTRMAVFRAVETGVSLVRVTLNGLSIAVDPRGEVRASSDAFESPGAAMSAVVPATRVPTVYARVGDLFGWLSVAGALGLAVTALRGRRRG